MSNIYNLYLDESETFTENNNNNNKNRVFGIAGIIVEENYANNDLTIKLNNLKKKLWYPTFTNYKDLILHEKEIKDVINTHNKFLLKNYKPHYQIFSDHKKVFLLYRELDKIIRQGDIVTVGACLKVSELDKLYDENIQNDRYFIALQIIIENFIHFLNEKQAKGRIIYEHNGNNMVKNIRMKFNIIKATGTLFINPYTMQELLIDINFPTKTENVAGLQIADFIPNSIIRKVCGKKEPPYSIYKNIKKVAYSGSGDKNRYGIKIIP